ncbi:hypothetical protein SCUCBS95973_003270 [Sporothrix curviconia]|uniref:N-acetyltransferase domain-containing protein n=1 Tax=Sporothrix curviconia TaxID=1260050 RepID=A0ABP0BE05_9PEZI
MEHFSTSLDWQTEAVRKRRDALQASYGASNTLHHDLNQHVEDEGHSVVTRGLRGAMPVNGRQSGQADRGKLTMESLAAFQAELQSEEKHQADNDTDKGKSAVAHPGKTMDDDFPEVLPDDSLSVVDDSSAGSAMTGAAWTQRAMQVYATPHDFKKSVKTWSAKIYPTPPLNNLDSEKWLKFDAEPDSLSRDLLHPPVAPEIRLDPSVLRDGPDSRRATQTAMSACMQHSLAQMARLQQDKAQLKGAAQVGPHVAVAQTPQQTPQQTSQKATLQAFQQASHQTSQAPDAGNPSPSPVNVPKSKIMATPNFPQHDIKPAAELPASTVPSPAPHSIRITAGTADHIDQIRDIYNEEFVKGTQAPGQQLASSQDIRRLYLASLQFKLPFIVAVSNNDDGGQHVLGVGFLQPRPLIGIVEPQDLYCADCSVFVQLKHRNRGIGQEILRSLLTIVTSHLAPQSADGEKIGDKQPGDNLETAQAPHPRNKFVRELETGASKTLPPLIHFIIVDIVCGNMGGLAEKKYAEVLTKKFGFKQGDLLDTVIWTKDGPSTAKKMMFHRICEQFIPRHEMSPPTPSTAPVPSGGPVQHPPVAQPMSQAVGPAKAALPARNMSPTRDNARFLPGRLLYDLVLAPATTGGSNNYAGGRAPANKPSAAQEFW